LWIGALGVGDNGVGGVGAVLAGTEISVGAIRFTDLVGVEAVIVLVVLVVPVVLVVLVVFVPLDSRVLVVVVGGAGLDFGRKKLMICFCCRF
jgi:hypothetical protein